MTRSSLAIAFVTASLLLLACYGPPPEATGGGDDEPPISDDCELDAPAGKTPGFPFDVETFRSDVLPVLAKSCGTAGCHQEPTGKGSFTIWSDAADDDCSFGQTFDQVAKQITVANPTTSRLLQAPSGGSTTHPRVLEAATAGYMTLKLYVDDAALRSAGDGDGPAGNDPHDAAVFKTVIQPMLDKAGCGKTGCHGSGLGGFTLVANATGADLDANFLEVTKRNDLASPEKSRVYFKGLNPHAGSTALSGADAKKFLDWVTAAAASAP